MESILKDLDAEYNSLDAIVSELREDQWQIVTPLDDWTIKDEISHIAYYDEAARLSATDGDAFAAHMAKMLEGITDMDSVFKKVNAIGGKLPVPKLLSWWRNERSKLLDAFRLKNPKDRLPWYGPPMSARSSATARIMETWAHGQDIVDALKIKRPGTERLKHVAHIGVTTFGWSFMNRKLDIPQDPVRVELTSPSGDIWEWGPSDAANSVKGDALDFSLVVTKRRHIKDTAIITKGITAEKWMSIAQAFAGPPEGGPQPGERMF
ncbi:MAG: TIGR03084 family protein [Proteobacteria bacterium]|nr:TIGR03084 family protein [Pseudomonadota bacterium]